MSAKEIELRQAVQDGATSQEIAAILGIEHKKLIADIEIADRDPPRLSPEEDLRIARIAAQKASPIAGYEKW